MATERVVLDSPWVAHIDADLREALVVKENHPSRKFIVQYNPPFLKRLHFQTRTPVMGTFNRMPPKIEKHLRREFESRWGTEEN